MCYPMYLLMLNTRRYNLENCTRVITAANFNMTTAGEGAPLSFALHYRHQLHTECICVFRCIFREYPRSYLIIIQFDMAMMIVEAFQFSTLTMFACADNDGRTNCSGDAITDPFCDVLCRIIDKFRPWINNSMPYLRIHLNTHQAQTNPILV